ncbi:YbgA family protein [Clostridium oryzae]|uniref:DUF1722 domain-containing protein n=1 Tax=Clostridium oryzae TaxID=1450648 RepID=A0A1V4IMA3_9CLOT|nr:DUF523 and DUF1722 domain-containing protein [Clostridium oryzae]OPJ60974.1 hypothetical protein CLORY_25230 [Clostridium oryzae]
MDYYGKPVVVISSCLGFKPCRYNGQMLKDKFVDELRNFIDFVDICPETQIGLEIPRQPIRLISEQNNIIVYEPKSQKEYTKEMLIFSDDFLKKLSKVDGFILKGRSPSCGIKDVKIYLNREKGAACFKGRGVFADRVITKYTYLAIEEEGRLTNFRIREHFLTKLYIMYRFRMVTESGSIAQLVNFQANNKYLLMAYHQREQKLLERIVAQYDKQPFNKVIDEYREHLKIAFARLPRSANIINSLTHIMEHFSDNLSSKEKEFILDSFNKYKDEKFPLSVPINILKTYAIKYEKQYLINQTIWCPYPEELMSISDTDKHCN